MNETVEVMDDVNVEPNPSRAIWLEGQLNQNLLERLRPEILDLTSRSREPVTLFVNSSGGRPEVKDGILNLLRRASKDDSRVPRIITVAAPKAGSAAANLLSAGDFAIAYSDSTLLYHGGRWPLSDLVDDGEAGLILARTLPTFREMAATELAANCVRRFMFIVSIHRALLAKEHSENADPTHDLKSFQLVLRGKLSAVGQRVLDRAIKFDESFNGVLLQFQKRLRRGRAVTNAHLRKVMLHAASDFVYATSSEAELGWDGGVGKITDHFYSLNSYFDLPRLCEWITTATTPQAPDAEADYVLRFRQFFLSICRALQEGENKITPSDALWLGLVDTLRNGPMPERPKCPWCSRSDLPLHRLKGHVKNCLAAPKPRWAENLKRRKAHGSRVANREVLDVR